MNKKCLLIWFMVMVGVLMACLFVCFHVNKHQNSDALEPPTGIIFAPDKLIDHLNGNEQLKYFTQAGQWSSKKDGSIRWIEGESRGEYIKLTSKQDLSNDKHGTLVFDCLVKEGGELGVFYGEYAIVISPQTMSLVKLNSINEKLDETNIATDYSMPMTLSIENGFGFGTETESTIRVNGKGFDIPQQTQMANLKFGILFKGEGYVRIGRFRWFRGGV